MSELRANTISDAAGTGPVAFTKQWAAKVVGSWDGTGTPAYVMTMNLSSLTDNATGDWTHNFTNSLADADYIFTGGCNFVNTTAAGLVTQNSTASKTTALIDLYTSNSTSGARGDYTSNGFQVMGDLA